MPKFETREQLTERIQALIGDRTDDDALNFIKDALETYDSRSSSDGSISKEEHERLMQEQDTNWRKRYRDTFFGSKPDESLANLERKTSKSDPTDSARGGSENNPSSYDELFGDK